MEPRGAAKEDAFLSPLAAAPPGTPPGPAGPLLAPQSEWLKCPHLFSCCTDPSAPNQQLCVSVLAAPERGGVCVSALDCGGGCYSALLSPLDLERIKPGHLSPPEFFGAITKQFMEQNYKVYRSGGKVMLILRDDVCFSLPHRDDASDVMWAMVASALESVELRSMEDPKAAVAALAQEVDQLRQQTNDLDAQSRLLRTAIADCQEEELGHTERYTALQAELVAATQRYHRLCETRGLDPKDFIGPLEPPAADDQSYGRQPLESDSRPFDLDLLQLIKASFAPEIDDSEDVQTPCVVPMLSPSDYDNILALLPEGKVRLVLECLQRIDDWDFDVWTMQDMTAQGALFYTAYALFWRWDLFRRLDIDEQVAINFFSQVEAGYHPNPYHNAVHAADVTHIVHFILGKGGGYDSLQLQPHDLLAMLIAGMIHDYDHPGLNNNFHVKVQSYLATLYNDRSVLENHHVAEAFDLMRNPKFNVLQRLSPAQFADVRETIIEVVLSTDMQQHARLLGAWKRRIGQNQQLGERKEDQRLALSMCIKMADISNCCRPLSMYLKWSSVLVDEFYLQGDNEKARGDPMSPFMDRQQPYLAKSQVAFMNFVVVPMFEAVAEFLPAMAFTSEIALRNVAYWKTQKEPKY